MLSKIILLLWSWVHQFLSIMRSWCCAVCNYQLLLIHQDKPECKTRHVLKSLLGSVTTGAYRKQFDIGPVNLFISPSIPSPPSLPFPSPPLLSPFPLSSLFLTISFPSPPTPFTSIGPLNAGLGERCKLLSGVWDRSTAEIEFGAV